MSHPQDENALYRCDCCGEWHYKYETRCANIEVVSYSNTRSYYVRVRGKALRTKDGKGPRLFRSETAARRAGEKAMDP